MQCSAASRSHMKSERLHFQYRGRLGLAIVNLGGTALVWVYRYTPRRGDGLVIFKE
ncbi:predicted protein [Plenodomus lingam JN3]|uniref:Uncharacterized protein n=1 Tax=Leptosphaeria maculans (strain JN3 / isolate v23.1.3 / race Av1-4-5-6-7-8) TaxID=985895 RepID=E4ZGJ6_LEPMJ|nr:predicted protein [Plenodomus lingam JN3]CBX90416.1 predicted protein [Plenodomus lingam JN3]